MRWGKFRYDLITEIPHIGIIYIVKPFLLDEIYVCNINS